MSVILSKIKLLKVPTYFSSTFNMLSKIKVLTAGIEGTLTHILCVINIISDVAYHQELYGLIDLLFAVFGQNILIHLWVCKC